MSQALRTADQADKDVIVFKALANPVRLQIVSFVAASPEGQVSAGQIVERFSLSQPTISHHLRVLREAGVLTTYKTSTFVFYRFAPQLRETVSAVLPDAAAVQPPAETTPARRAPARKRPAAPEPESAPAHEAVSDDAVGPGPETPPAQPVDQAAMEAAAEAAGPRAVTDHDKKAEKKKVRGEKKKDRKTKKGKKK